jgi:hypothetical protein
MWHVTQKKSIKNAYRSLVEYHEGKRSLGRPRRTWEDDTEMDHKK